MGMLRFILAIGVVISHSSSIFGFTPIGGLSAVKAFYIVSGFYMSLILNEKYIGINNSYKLFITNRFLRLFPIYWAVLLLTCLLSVFIIIYTKGDTLGNFSIYAKYFNMMSVDSIIFLAFTNVFIFFQDIVMFLGLNTATGHLFFTSNFNQTSPELHEFLFIPQAWSLGVEISFYLIAPFLVRKKLKIIFFLITLSLLLRFILSKYGLRNDPWSYRFFPTELVFFLLGTISYHMYSYLRRLKIKVSCLKVIFGYITGFSILFNFLPIHGKSYVYFFSFFICLPFVFILTKKWKRDSYIGELSYPIYISHFFILNLITFFKIPVVGGLGLNLTILTVVFSIFLNETIAKKIEVIRQKRINFTLHNG